MRMAPNQAGDGRKPGKGAAQLRTQGAAQQHRCQSGAEGLWSGGTDPACSVPVAMLLVLRESAETA